MPEMIYSDAVRDGLAEEMRRDSNVWCLGEDLSTSGGSTKASQYDGLIEEFGPSRVVNTPISENTILGAGVGAAVAGTRPVADLTLCDFAMCATDELVNQAAKIRYMFGGQVRVPIVVRQSIGVRRGAAAQHSQSTEAWWVSVPGLVVVTPATPADGKGMLKAAIRSDDPVVFMEHKGLWAATGEVPEGDEVVPIGEAKILRPGSDLTIVAWSKMALDALDAAEELSRVGIDAEVIDLRSLWPWDRATVFASVEKTGRVLIPQESVLVGGFGAELASTIGEALHQELRLPVKRIGAPRVPVPFAKPLEDQVRVTTDHVVSAARSLIERTDRVRS